MRRAIKTLDEAVRNAEDVAPVCAFADALVHDNSNDNNFGGSDRVFLDLVERTTRSRRRFSSSMSSMSSSVVVILVRFTMDERLITDALLNGRSDGGGGDGDFGKEERGGVLVLDANAFGAFDATEKPLDALLGKLGEILDKRRQPATTMEEGKREAKEPDAAGHQKNSSSIRSGIFGYASNDSVHRVVVFLDDVSCVSFIHGERSVVRFVREVQRMSRTRGVVVRERTSSARYSGNASSGRNRGRRSARSSACEVLANDASCSCAMTIYRQNPQQGGNGGNDRRNRKTLLTVEARRGATRKTRETDVVRFVKVPDSSSTTPCIALEYTSIDDALRNEKDIQKARERARAAKLTDKLNKFSTFNLGIDTHASNGNQRERDAKRNVKLAYEHEGRTTTTTNDTFRRTLPRDAGGLRGRSGQGHGEKLKNLLEYERDETDEHDYGSGVDTDEEIDDLDDF